MAQIQDALRYADQVIAGEVVAGRLVKQACERFIDDLENAEAKGLYFDQLEAQRILDFYDIFIKHVKGELAGQTVEIEPWQAFILINLFGWYQVKDNLRRFRTAYIEVARKNAKSTLSSGIALFLTGFDSEPGAEVYSAATKKDQAKIVFNDASEMINKSPELRRSFGVHRNNIHNKSSYSKFEPLSADANSLDGLNISGAVVDELHAHKTREVWDVLETATGARRQPMIVAITTAGSNQQGICYEQRDYVTKILGNLAFDESYFGVIYTLDDEDDWLDESKWIKANPNIGVSVKWDDIRRLALKAKEQTTAKNNFLTKRLNRWVTTASVWLNMEFWERAPRIANDESLQLMPCWIGIDLANKLDIAAVVCVFKDGKDYHVKSRFYIPEDNISAKSKTIGVMYELWAESGFLTTTPGNIIDHEIIEEDIRELLSEYNVQEVAFDPWGSVQMANHLSGDGAPMIEVPQTVKNMSEAMKELEALVMAGKIHHGDNPVLNWMASNVTCEPDRNENVFPRKERADNKIDGIVALITALSRIIRVEADDGHAYLDRGFITL